MNKIKILVTGGAGFIGSAVIRHIINNSQNEIINIDNLTYAGNQESLISVEGNNRYIFEKVNILDEVEILRIFNQYKPDLVMHLAAESHVDRSIDGPSEFIQTNIIGTYILLEQARTYWSNLKGDKKNHFRFHHISTDEVYGDLNETDDLFTEESSYKPSSPYAASKASSDHLVRSWYRTYGLPTIITNCSNNYGPYQFPEKLIPLIILNALEIKKLPIYGTGENIRDWLYVDDHAVALLDVATKGVIGETYNIGGNNEMKNIDVVGDIRHKGMLMGIELVSDKEKKIPIKTKKSINKVFFEEGKKQGIYLRTLGNIVMLVPPLSIKDNELELLLRRTIKTIQASKSKII